MWWPVCRVADRQVAVSVQAPAQVRRWAADLLVRWELPGEVDRTLLVLNELVTNAIVHAAGAPRCRLTVDSGCLEVVVTDTGPGPPRRALRGADAADPGDWARPGGRGLQIVAAVARSWGTAYADGRSGVWARWPVAAPWAYAAGCVCPTRDHHDGPPGDAVRLASGAAAVAMPGPWDAPG